MDKKRFVVALVLFALGAAVSGVLLLQHHGEPSAAWAVAEACGAGEANGCDRVNQSPWSGLAGVPLAAVGLGFYLSLASLALLAPQAGDAAPAAGRVAFTLLVLALAVDVVLLALQAFSIGAYCTLCLTTYALNAAALYALWPARKADLLSASPEGRLLAYGWGASTLAVALFVLAWNGALRERAERRAGALLGAPAGAGASDPQAEVARLKGILDDPHQYEEYQQQKAMGEFEAAQPQPIDMDAVPFKGPAAAKVKVVEYSDFLCPFCQRIAGAFRDFLTQSGDRVSVHFKNFPLDKACNPTLKNDIHPGACLLARGALCANAQGRFWEYHDKVFSAPPPNPDRNRVMAIASASGLDAGRFGACLEAPETAARLRAEIEEAQRAGVNSTPTIFINGKRLPRLNDFLLAVDRESQLLGLPPLQPAKP
jgi:protein-disulfide isomerase/uncharacterized membrane protein